MDAVQILMLVLQLVVGLLTGTLAWMFRDVRGRLGHVEDKVNALHLLVAGEYVKREECRQAHQAVDAKFKDFDRDRERTHGALARLDAEVKRQS